MIPFLYTCYSCRYALIKGYGKIVYLLGNSQKS